MLNFLHFKIFNFLNIDKLWALYVNLNCIQVSTFFIAAYISYTVFNSMHTRFLKIII